MTNITTFKNGSYIANVNAYPDSKRRIVVFNDQATVYTLQGVFVCKMNAEAIESLYSNFVKQTKQNTLYNLVWMYKGEIRETLLWNASYALCQAKKKAFKAMRNYSDGLLLPVPARLS